MKEIFTRRSIRKYTAEPVSEADLEKLLRAAMAAPSAGNQQPWEFVVVRDREAMQKILEFHPYARPLDTANVAIVICGDRERQRFPEDYWVQDCSAATQNLLLEAEHLGLGAVWMGVFPIDARVQGVQQLFGLPEHVVPLGVIAVGHPAETPAPKENYRPERIHLERW